MQWWYEAAFAISATALGLALLVDPTNFAPMITNPRAITRRRIFGAGLFLLMGCVVGEMAFHDATTVQSYGREGGLPVCLQFGLALMFAIPATVGWIQIVGRARGHKEQSNHLDMHDS